MTAPAARVSAGGAARARRVDEVDRAAELTALLVPLVERAPGVHALGSLPALLGAAVRLRGAQVHRAPGLTVALAGGRTVVDIALVAEVGTSLPEVAGAVRDDVVRAVHRAVGPGEVHVDVRVLDLHTAVEDEVARERGEPVGDPARTEITPMGEDDHA